MDMSDLVPQQCPVRGEGGGGGGERRGRRGRRGREDTAK